MQATPSGVARARGPAPVLRRAARRPRRGGSGETPRAPRSPDGDGRGRALPGCPPATRHGVAVVEQGDRYRQAMRAARGRAHRAGHKVVLPGRRRISRDARGGPRSPVARPHDAGPVPAPLRGGGALLPDRRRADPRDRHRERGPRRAGDDERGDGARPRPGGDRPPARGVHRAPAQSARRRGDDVRPGQLRALPPQDLQRRMDGGRGGAGGHPLRDDPEHPGEEPRGGALRLPRQRGGDRRRPGAVAGARARNRSLRRS